MLCSITDIFPTICDLLGLKVPPDLDGTSLAPLIEGTAKPDFRAHDYLFSESYPFVSGDQSIGRNFAINNGKEKLIFSPYGFPFEPTYQLYDLTTDPGEENNLYSTRTELSIILSGLLNKWVSEDEIVAQGVPGQIEREALKTLQYLN
jgi:arylsulfatase A-like enzyme